MRNTSKFLAVVLFTAFTASLSAQKKATYDIVKEENGLVYSAKWVDLKGLNAGKKGLFVKVTNKTDKTLNYSLGVELFVDGVMEEASQVSDFCIGAKKTMQGRLNGIYFVPETVKASQIGTESFTLELSGEFKGEAEGKCP
jgi:hypothetical protein